MKGPERFIDDCSRHQPASPAAPRWERACSRRGPCIQHPCRLTGRLRGQARSHRLCRHSYRRLLSAGLAKAPTETIEIQVDHRRSEQGQHLAQQ
ncbi:hypothetical protein KW846_19335 [Pseudomonas sp. PDM32]|nr:hypothetical protein [Pseudomonas sp. PDM32]MBV7574866.1 hypothetical protein [Pseudomonas sp. PDM32]